MSDKADSDEAFDRALEAFLADQLSPGGEECPSSGFLAACYENKLEPVEAELVNRHLSGCSSCQRVMAALVRLDPTPSAEAAPPAPPQLAEPTAERRALGRRGWRWVAAPVALAATAVIAVMLTRQHPAMTSGAFRRAVEAEAPTVPLAEAPAVAKKDEVGRTAASSGVKPDEGGAGASGLTAPAPPVPSLDLPEAASVAKEGLASGRAASSAAPELLAPSGAATEARQESAAVAEKPAGEPDRALADGLAPAPATEKRPALLVAARSNEQVSWRLRNDSIERSDDGGATWGPQASAVGGRLLSGSAPSAKVCWVAGEQGIVLRTTDGTHWRQTKRPVAEDLVEIVAQDASTAVVKTSSGRRFSTRNGGRTWSGP